MVMMQGQGVDREYIIVKEVRDKAVRVWARYARRAGHERDYEKGAPHWTVRRSVRATRMKEDQAEENRRGHMSSWKSTARNFRENSGQSVAR
ncbi:hypothetical protein RSAG8_04779, partial [Rhizoctonia solani AG-8 WAC10335]